jgi:hypothetical protein
MAPFLQATNLGEGSSNLKTNYIIKVPYFRRMRYVFIFINLSVLIKQLLTGYRCLACLTALTL